jgi:hypothetical protein
MGRTRVRSHGARLSRPCRSELFGSCSRIETGFTCSGMVTVETGLTARITHRWGTGGGTRSEPVRPLHRQPMPVAHHRRQVVPVDPIAARVASKDGFRRFRRFKRACRKLWRRPQDGLCRPQFHALLTCGRPKQSASSRFCSHTVQAPTQPKPLRSHSIASKPWIVRRAV